MDYFWIPYIEVETNAGVREVSLATKHFAKRKLFMIGEINSESISRLVSQLMYLCQESDEEIDLYINSGGGEVNAGLILYDVIQSLKAPLNIYCMGMAASMAAVILAGGQKGRRFILPHSKTMIHEPLIRNGMGGSATSIRNLSDSIMETRELVNSLLAKHTGKSLEEINEATAFDNYMNAQESVEFGLCDEIRNMI